MTAATASENVLVDSSGWLEYLTGDAKEALFAPYLESETPVLLPTVVLYEVRKVLFSQQGKSAADSFFSEALKHILLPFDEILAVAAVTLSIHHKLSMADAIIYATAQRHQAQLITSDQHFAGLRDVVLL